jgi:menaquinone-dependent protoporphyrinogen oxidase
MKVLVTAASRHGATAAIAERIAETLMDAGLIAVVLPPEAVGDVDAYDAVVLGSGVYAGHWLDPAKKLAERQAASLLARPVWLFSSGPIGEPLRPEGDPADVVPIVERLRPRGHRVFGGFIDSTKLGLGERAIVRIVGAGSGDHRPWADIEAWAAEIATALTTQQVAAST